MRTTVFLVCLALASCMRGDGPAGPRYPSLCPADASIVAATMNAGLAPGVVGMATLRTKPYAAAIAAERTDDVVCLQEVWQQEAVDDVVSKLDLPPDHVFHVDTRGKHDRPGEYVCEPSRQLEAAETCAWRRCGWTDGEDATLCIQQQCVSELISLYRKDGKCLECLAHSVGHSISDVIGACTSGPGVTRAYEGQNGVILASRWPLKNREVVDLPSSNVNRVGLIATVDIPGAGPIEVGCVHLSTQNPIPPDAGFRTWQDEQAAQFRAIDKRLKERAKDRPILFLGDFNAGPETDNGISGISERVWNEILKLGYASPFASLLPPVCSDCVDNSLKPGAEHNHIIDHVLVHEPAFGKQLEPRCAERFLDRKTPIRGYGGRTVETNLSDHYGVRVRFRMR